jgi:hypothetical protein
MGVLEHEDKFGRFTFSLNVANITANTTVTQNFNIRNLRVDDWVSLSCPTLNTGLGIIDAYCLTPEVLTIRFMNNTVAAINPGVVPFFAYVYRAEKTQNATPF